MVEWFEVCLNHAITSLPSSCNGDCIRLCSVKLLTMSKMYFFNFLPVYCESNLLGQCYVYFHFNFYMSWNIHFFPYRVGIFFLFLVLQKIGVFGMMEWNTVINSPVCCPELYSPWISLVLCLASEATSHCSNYTRHLLLLLLKVKIPSLMCTFYYTLTVITSSFIAKPTYCQETNEHLSLKIWIQLRIWKIPVKWKFKNN